MKCSKCGVESPAGRKVCAQCGNAEEPVCEPRGLNGQEGFEKSMAMILSGQGSAEERIELLGKALQSGLPLDDETKAHAFLGAELLYTGNDEEAIDHYEKGLSLSINSIAMFRDEAMVSQYRKLCLKYVSMARTIGEERGAKEALAFLEAKAMMLQDLSSPGFYVKLATLLANKGDIEKASVYFVKASKGRVIDDADSKAMDSARQSLSEIAKKGKIDPSKTGGAAESHAVVSPETTSDQKMPGQIKKSKISFGVEKATLKKYLVVGAIILGLFMVASFISLYHAPVKPEPDVSSVPKKAEPQQPPQPPQTPSTVEVPKQEEVVIQEPAPKQPVEPPRAQSREAARTAKTEKPVRKLVPKISQRKIDRPSEPQTGKSFAPHSRDDL
jgi:hypothetical protein